MRKPFKREPDPFAPNRYEIVAHGGRLHRLRYQWWFKVLVAVLSVLVLLVSYGAWKFISTQSKFQEDLEDVEPGKNEQAPFNALLVGSDSREGLTEEEQLALGADEVGGERADTIILAHIDPEDQSVTMVQFPRDLYVPIAGGGEAKINSALVNGPNQLVRTIESLTGLEVNQYVQVNIAGFRDMVDAIGGVELCITEPIPFDPQTGIEISEDELGMVKFDGERALRYVRSRRFPSGDFERIQNQQRFVAAAINKITSTSTITRPHRLNQLADVAAENVTTDNNTSIGDLKKLAERLRTFDPERYEAYVVPNLGIAAIGGASVVLPDEEAMEVLFDAISQNRSPAEADGVPEVEPSTIEVGIYDGTGTGAADAAAAELAEATDVGEGPVEIAETGDADRANYRKTLVVHDPDKPQSEEMADLVAAAMPGARLREGDTPRGVDVAVVLGRRGARIEPIVQLMPIQLPEPSEPPRICRRG